MVYDIKGSGARIRQLRIQNGYTQEKLAEVLNVDQSYYGRIETGKRGCPVDLFIQLSMVPSESQVEKGSQLPGVPQLPKVAQALRRCRVLVLPQTGTWMQGVCSSIDLRQTPCAR